MPAARPFIRDLAGAVPRVQRDFLGGVATADEFAYPQDMVKQRLKKVSRYLTFHSDHELKELGVKGKVIYRVPHR